MTALERSEEHVHDVQRIARFVACLDCGEILSERWEPQTLSDVEAIMGWRHAEKVQIAALKQRINNLQQMIRQHEARENWLALKWKPLVESIVDGYLAVAKGKARSVLLEFGRVGRKMSRGSIEIVDEKAAVAWAEAHIPEAVKVEKSVLKLPLAGLERELPENAFKVVPPTDQFFVSIS